MVTPSVLHIDTGKLLRGGQRQLLLLSARLKAMGVNQIIAAPRGTVLAGRIDELPLVPIPDQSFLRLIRHRALKRAMMTREVNIVHAHDSQAHSLAVMLKRWNPSLKVVVTRRVTFAPSGFLSRHFKYRRSVDQYIAISRAVAASLLQIGVPPDRIEVIPSGLDIDGIAAIEADRAYLTQLLPDCRKIIVSVGSLTVEKDMATALRTFSVIQQKSPETGMIVLGEGPQKSGLERLKQALRLDRLVLAGHKEPIAPILKACDVFLLTSTSEGLNTSAIEAAACGLPLVASDVGGLPEIVEHEYNGFLCPPGNPERFAEALGELLINDSLRREMSARSAAKAKGFDIGGAAAKTLALYNSLLAG